MLHNVELDFVNEELVSVGTSGIPVGSDHVVDRCPFECLAITTRYSFPLSVAHCWPGLAGLIIWQLDSQRGDPHRKDQS